MTQNNYNWSSYNLQQIYSEINITLEGLVGICTTSSGSTTYLLDMSGYVLILSNSNTISTPNFLYSATKVIENPSPTTNYAYNLISCSSDGQYIIIAYPPSSQNEFFTYYLSSNSGSSFSQITDVSGQTNAPMIQISGNGQYIGILINTQLYLSENYGSKFINVSQQITYFAISYSGITFLVYQNNIYNYDYVSESLLLCSQKSTWPNYGGQPYIDYTGQYFDFFSASTSNIYLNYISTYEADISAISILDGIYNTAINNTNNSLGNYLIIALGNNTVLTTTSGPTSFIQETYFNNKGLIIFVSTNYCDSTNQPISVCIGSTSGSQPENIFMFYYGYSNTISST